MFKKILPYEFVIYRTNLNEAEVIQRLQSVIENGRDAEPEPFMGEPRHTRPYQGFIMRNTFYITRIQYTKNAFKAIASGTITEIENGTEIKVIMRPGFMGLLSFALALLFLIVSIRIGGFYWVELTFILFPFFLLLVFFKPECREIKEDLKRLFSTDKGRGR